MRILGDDVFTSGDVPHALLFPRLAAVVHHGGAGTSAAALRAGVKQQAHGRAAARAAQHLATENGADRVLNAIQQLTDG